LCTLIFIFLSCFHYELVSIFQEISFNHVTEEIGFVWKGEEYMKDKVCFCVQKWGLLVPLSFLYSLLSFTLYWDLDSSLGIFCKFKFLLIKKPQILVCVILRPRIMLKTKLGWQLFNYLGISYTFPWLSPCFNAWK